MERKDLEDLVVGKINNYGKAAWDFFCIVALENSGSTARNRISDWVRISKNFLEIVLKIHMKVRNWGIEYLNQIVGIQSDILNSLDHVGFFDFSSKPQQEIYEIFNSNQKTLQDILFTLNFWNKEGLQIQSLKENLDSIQPLLFFYSYEDQDIFLIDADISKLLGEYLKNTDIDFQTKTINIKNNNKFLSIIYQHQIFLVKNNLGFFASRVSAKGNFNLDFKLIPTNYFPAWLIDFPEELINRLQNLIKEVNNLDYNPPIDEWTISTKRFYPEFLEEKEIEEYLYLNYDLIEKDIENISRQYPLDIGNIDLLATTEQQEKIIIEIKNGPINHKSVGQLQAYMESYQHQMEGKEKVKEIRGILIGNGISSSAYSSCDASKYNTFIEFRTLKDLFSPGNRHICDECGNVNRKAANFCDYCGSKLVK